MSFINYFSVQLGISICLLFLYMSVLEAFQFIYIHIFMVTFSAYVSRVIIIGPNSVDIVYIYNKYILINNFNISQIE